MTLSCPFDSASLAQRRTCRTSELPTHISDHAQRAHARGSRVGSQVKEAVAADEAVAAEAAAKSEAQKAEVEADLAEAPGGPWRP